MFAGVGEKWSESVANSSDAQLGSEACSIGTGTAGLFGRSTLVRPCKRITMAEILPNKESVVRSSNSCTPKQTSCACANATRLRSVCMLKVYGDNKYGNTGIELTGLSSLSTLPYLLSKFVPMHALSFQTAQYQLSKCKRAAHKMKDVLF